jgi:hypothetical protein
VPYWKKADVALPFGFTVPFSVALFTVMLVAVPVTGVGPGHAPVVNIASLPFDVPPTF